MPRGSTNPSARGTTGRENFARDHHPRDFALPMAPVEGTSGRNAGRRAPPRSSRSRALDHHMTGGRYSHPAERDVYNWESWSSSSSSDDDDDDDLGDDTVARGPRSEIRVHRDLIGSDIASFSRDDSARRRREGTSGSAIRAPLTVESFLRNTSGPRTNVGENHPLADHCDLLTTEARLYRESHGSRSERTPAPRRAEYPGSSGNVSRYADQPSGHSRNDAIDDGRGNRPRGGGRAAGASSRRGSDLFPASRAQDRHGQPSSRRY